MKRTVSRSYSKERVLILQILW